MITGQSTLITGGGSGLGAALSHRFVDEGACVTIVDIDLDRAREVADSIESDNVLPMAADVRDPAQLHRVTGAAVERFGKIDTVIPNAGLWDYGRSVTKLNGDELAAAFDELFAVNVKGYLLTVEATWRELVKSRGSIIMTLSNASFYAAGGGPIYTASKFADRGLMLEFAYELAPKVRVNGVAVGGMATDLSGPKSIGLDTRSIKQAMEERAEEGNPYLPLHHTDTAPSAFTGPYVMLASPTDAGNITGTVINIDGGIAARGFAQSAGGDSL